MESRPPPSILLATSSGAILGLMGIVALGWSSFRWLSGGTPAVPSVMGLLGLVAVGRFIEQALRRRRSVRIPAIAVALTTAGVFAVLILTLAVAQIADRWSALAWLGMLTLLLTLVAAPLLRGSARTWLSQ